MHAKRAEMNGWHKVVSRIMLSMSAFFFIIGYGGLWLLNDLMGGLSSMLHQNNIVPYGTTTGFANYTYIQTFHLGMWATSVSLFMLLLFVIWSVKHE